MDGSIYQRFILVTLNCALFKHVNKQKQFWTINRQKNKRVFYTKLCHLSQDLEKHFLEQKNPMVLIALLYSVGTTDMTSARFEIGRELDANMCEDLRIKN
jgi:hypothetical protein